MKTPVALFIFNRPHLTARVWQRLRELKPPALYIVADGPREDRPADLETALETRRVTENVDWPCEVHRLFREENRGTAHGIVEGLDWVFECVSEAIILEDDVLPNQDFVDYCEALLERYRDAPEVGWISGNNLLGSWAADGSYFFSRYASVWGWASWRRAWKDNDFYLKRYPPETVRERLASYLGDSEQAEHLAFLVETLRRAPQPKWDAPWQLTNLLEGRFCAIPTVNITENIGFGPGATNCHKIDDIRDLPRMEMPRPIAHPSGTPLENYDRRFELWQYWTTLLARYEDLPKIQMWGRAMARRPDIKVPWGGSSNHFRFGLLTRPEEVGPMLEHVVKSAPGHSHRERLCQLFSELAKFSSGPKS